MNQSINTDSKNSKRNRYTEKPVENIDLKRLLANINISTLNNEQRDGLEGLITYDELILALKKAKNNKSPGSDGFTVEFFKFFWTDIGYFLLRSLNHPQKATLVWYIYFIQLWSCQESVAWYRIALCWYFTALQHFSGHFGHGQLTCPQCSWASFPCSLPVISAHSFARNWLLLFLNQPKGETGHWNYFMTNLQERMLPYVRIEPATVHIPGGRASDRAYTASKRGIELWVTSRQYGWKIVEVM